MSFRLSHPTLLLALLLWVPTLLGATPVLAQGAPEDLETVARDYMRALEAMDWEAQASFYTEDSVFEDPTAVYFGVPWKIIGGQAIADFWRTSTEDADTLEVRHDIRRLFVTGPYVVIDYSSHVRMTGSMIGFPDRELEGAIEVATVLKIQHGKVLHHLDHADYASAWETLEAVKKRFEEEAAAASTEPADSEPASDG